MAGALRSVACGPKVPTPGQGQTVEIGAEATVDTKDDWQVAQHQLYGELSQQLQNCGPTVRRLRTAPRAT